MAPVAPMEWPWRLFGGADGDLRSLGAEDLMDGGGFYGVVGLGAGAVGADVADFFGGDVGVFEGFAHGCCSAFGGWSRDVAGVGGHAEADDLTVDGCIAGLCAFEGFEHEHGGAFAEGHTVAVCGEGAAGGRGDYAHAVPRAEEAEGEGRIVAAGDGCGDHSGADHVKGEADGVGSGGAGGGDGEDGPGDAEVDGDVAGAGAGHGAGDGEGMDAGVAGVEIG